tara:strand:- start:9815 stop:11794 length:1980 start_codon:yes stop_codon:yes gene_type:complete
MITKKLNHFLGISKIKRITYRKDINGLRAIAVLAVVFYHADIFQFNGGWLGVDVFFVISGYLISNIIISELNESKFAFIDFYIRRIRRILPALFSTLIFTLPFSYFLLTPKAIIEYAKSLFASIFFYANYYFQNLDFYNAEPTKVMPLLHTWSLAIEEQFYLLFPLFCMLIYKLNKRLFSTILFMFFFSSIYLNSTTSELIKFYQIQFRAWELLLGALVMIFQNKIRIKYIDKLGFILLLFSFIYFDDSMLTINSIEPRIISNLSVSMILISRNDGIVNSFLGSKLFKLIGLSSYSVYLLHQPLFAFLRLAQKKYDVSNSSYSVLLALIFLLILSYINWKYVEKVFQKISTKKLFSFLFFGLLTTLSVAFLAIEKDGFVERFNYVPDNVLFYSLNPNIYPLEFSNEEYKYLNTDCSNKLSNSSYCSWSHKLTDKNIYLIGDSQTNSLSVSFLIEFDSLRDKYNLIFIRGKLGRCLLSQQSDTVGIVDECSDETFENFISRLNKEKDVVIAFGRFDTWIGDKGIKEIKCNDCDNTEVIEKRLKQLASSSSKLYLVEPVPTFDYSVAESYLYKRNTWGVPVTIELSDWDLKIRKTKSFFSSIKDNKIEIISTIPIFCETKREMKCFASTEDKLYYSDSNHLTLEGAKLLAEKIELELNKLE